MVKLSRPRLLRWSSIGGSWNGMLWNTLRWMQSTRFIWKHLQWQAHLAGLEGESPFIYESNVPIVFKLNRFKLSWIKFIKCLYHFKHAHLDFSTGWFLLRHRIIVFYKISDLGHARSKLEDDELRPQAQSSPWKHYFSNTREKCFGESPVGTQICHSARSWC